MKPDFPRPFVRNQSCAERLCFSRGLTQPSTNWRFLWETNRIGPVKVSRAVNRANRANAGRVNQVRAVKAKAKASNRINAAKTADKVDKAANRSATAAWTNNAPSSSWT